MLVRDVRFLADRAMVSGVYNVSLVSGRFAVLGDWDLRWCPGGPVI
jgi:hypothetical protein